jgi:hypothetical protein
METSSNAVEIATVGRNEDGKIELRLWNGPEIDKFLQENELAEKKDTETMQE